MRASVVILGTGGAMLSAGRDNTALAFRLDGGAVLVDAPGSVYLKLLRAGIDPLRLSAVVITHTHPDHVYGLPSLIHSLWMMSRTVPVPPLPIFLPEADREKVRQLLDLFDLNERATFMEFRTLPADPSAAFWTGDGHRLFAHPVDHGPPSFAVRWDTAAGRRVLYSTDTRPLEAVAAFGREADLCIHEATFAEDEAGLAAQAGHTTAAQAGRIATLAGAKRLVLVHLADYADAERWKAEAMTTFAGPVEVPDDGAVYAVD